MADLNTPAGQLGNAIGGVGGGMQGVSKDIQARLELQDNLRKYFGQADIFGGEAFFDDLEKGADFRLMKTDHGGSHVVKIGRGDTGHQILVDNQRFNKWNAQNKATAAAGTVAPSTARSSVPVAPQAAPVTSQPVPAPDVANTNASKVIPLADEYDTGLTAAKVASGEPIATPPPKTTTSAPKGPTVGTTVDNATTSPKVDGPRVSKPAPVSSSMEDLVGLADDQKRNMAGLLDDGAPQSTKAAAKISSNVDDVNMTARQAVGHINDQIKTLRKTKKIFSNDGAKGVAEAVTQGIKGSKNLRLAALGTAVGLGGYAASRFQHRNNNSDLRG